MSMSNRRNRANQSRGGGWQVGDYVLDDSSHTGTNSVKYKWAAGLVEVIQFILNILTKCILTILEFFLNTSPCQFFRQTWNFVLTTLTIEIVTTAKEEQFDTMIPTTGGFCGMGLPVLRLNSVTMEEYLRDSAEDSGLGHEQDGCSSASEFLPSSNYNSSDAETDGGQHIFTCDEDADVENKDEDEFVPNKTGNSSLPQETQFSRRDSDTSDDGVTDEQKSAEITQRLVSQVEVMFSDEHLAKDGFLLKHVRRRSDGYVSLKLVAGLRKVKQISRDFPTVLAALRLSLKLEVNLDGTKVRRMEPLTPFLKSLPILGGNKEGSAPNNKPRPSADLTHDELLNRVSMRNCANNNQQMTNGQHKKISRNNSNASTGSSNASSRHGSFSKQYHAGTSPAELFYRNVHALSADDTPQVNRRRGGSLPIPMNGCTNSNVVNVGGPSPTYYHYQRNSMYLSPNSSPPSGNEMPQRPKFANRPNSYCEGTGTKNSPSGTGGMSVWLQRRMASTRSSEGTIVLAGVVRQPRGPDGTKGFANGYRQLILEEKKNLPSCSA